MKIFALTGFLSFYCFFLTLTMILFTADAAGQVRSDPADRITVNEDFDLDIGEKRVTEGSYQRSTQVEINAGNLSVRAGAEVRAAKIDLVLRGVTGRVRFRASFESLRQLIQRARALPRRAVEPSDPR